MDVDSGRKFLQEKAEGKPSVYEHFASIIDKVVLQKPDDPFGALEVLSRLLKVETPQSESFEENEIEAMKTKATSMMAVTAVPTEGDDPATAAPKTVCAIPDFMEESAMLEWAGVGFGELESYQIMCSLRKLAAASSDDGIKQLRFWGKILGISADYYVAEGQLEAGGEPDENDPTYEPSGEGCNAFTFWVTTSLTGTWEKLPHTRAKHIIAARKIKKIMTGDLNAKVITHPHFPGTEKECFGPALTEKELLRAQIAQITADTVLCINGFVVLNDDGGLDEEAMSQFKTPPVSDLAKLDGWTHERDHILKSGRTKHDDIPEEPPDEEEERKKVEKMKKEQEADPKRSRIRAIATDPDLQWAVRQGGDKSLYSAGAEGEVKSYAVTTVRCLTWPGAVTVAKGESVTNIYVGQGLKYGEPDFFPCAPLDIQEEPEDPVPTWFPTHNWTLVTGGEMAEPQPEGAPPSTEKPEQELDAGG